MKNIVLLLCCLAFLPFSVAQAELTKEITVYKNPNCGCCKKWISYLEGKGYKVKAVDTRDVFQWKKKFGVPEKISSCHTAMIDGYVVEGHVTVRDIKRLLLTRPKIKGIAVPGMPVGTPGMEKGDAKAPYNVYSFDEKGNTEVFVEHP